MTENIESNNVETISSSTKKDILNEVKNTDKPETQKLDAEDAILEITFSDEYKKNDIKKYLKNNILNIQGEDKNNGSYTMSNEIYMSPEKIRISNNKSYRKIVKIPLQFD